MRRTRTTALLLAMIAAPAQPRKISRPWRVWVTNH